MTGAAGRFLAVVLLVGIGALLGGCFTRRIVIDTTPVSAEVFINQRSMGPSPVAIETADFGDLDLRIEAPGYVPVWRRLAQPRPWYGYDPMLFVLEMAPYPFRTEQVHRVELMPQPAIEPQQLNARAQAAAAAIADLPTERK